MLPGMNMLFGYEINFIVCVQNTKFSFVVYLVHTLHVAVLLFVCLNATIEDYGKVVKTFGNSIKMFWRSEFKDYECKNYHNKHTSLVPRPLLWWLEIKSGNGLEKRLLTDLFIIWKLAWTSVICDNTGPPGRVCINVMCCQCCLKQLDPQSCNRF